MREHATSAPAAIAAAPAGAADRTGLLLIASITLFWGVNWPAMKLAVAEVPVWTFRTLCLVVGGIGLLAICRMAKLPIRVPRGQLGPLLINSLLNITGWHVLSAYGLQHMDAGRASIIAFTMPLWAALMAVPVLGERMSAVTLAGLAVGMAGMAALIVPEWRAIVSAPLGLTFMLLSALSWALGTVLLKRWRWDMPTSVLAGWQLLLGGLPVAVGALIFDRDFEPQAVSWVAWSAVAFAALIPSIYCQWAWCRIVAIHPAAVAGISTLAIPVVGVLSSSLALKEPIGIDIMLSLVLVLAGLCLVLIVPALRPRPRRAG